MRRGGELDVCCLEALELAEVGCDEAQDLHPQLFCNARECARKGTRRSPVRAREAEPLALELNGELKYVMQNVRCNLLDDGRATRSCAETKHFLIP